MQLEHLTLTCRPETGTHRLPVERRRGLEWRETYAWIRDTCVARELTNRLGLDVIDTSVNMAETDTKYLSATTRRTLLALMPLCFGEAWDGYDGVRTEMCDDAQHNSVSFHGRSLSVDFLACEPSDVYRGCVISAHAHGQDHPKMQLATST